MSELVNDIPVVKIFTHDNKYYCYDTYTNYLLQVTREIYLEICRLKKVGVMEYKKLCMPHSAYKDVLALIDKGLFKFDFIKKIIHPDTKYIEQLIERCMNQLVLEVTSTCNFKCRYCHQPSKSTPLPKMMTEDIAFKSVDFLFEHSKNVNEISITFYGGEPLLNFKLIKRIVSYANKKFESKSILYNMTTNASLLSESIVRFLVKNKFSLLISLDGDRNTQNYHRKYLSDGGETFNDVWKNILEIRNNYSSYFNTYVNFNAVVMPDENPKDVLDFFAKHSIPRTMVKISHADLTGIDYDLTKPIVNDYSYDEFESKFKDMLERFKSKDRLPTEYHHSGPCMPVVRRLFVSTEGNFYPCEKVEGASACLLGNLSDGVNMTKAAELLNIGGLTREDCKRCWAMRLCSICVRQCLDGDYISYQKKKIACAQLQQNALLFLIEYIKDKETRG